MYICAEKKKIPCAASGAAGGWTFTGEGVESVQGAFTLHADSGFTLAEFDTADWLRTQRAAGSLVLTNTPEAEPQPEPAPPEPSPAEVNAQAIAELSIVQAEMQAQTDQALAELSLLVAEGGGNHAV